MKRFILSLFLINFSLVAKENSLFIYEIKGKALAHTTSGNTFPLSNGDNLEYGHYLFTDHSSRLGILVGKDIKILIGENSVVKFEYSHDEITIIQKRGQLRALKPVARPNIVLKTKQEVFTSRYKAEFLSEVYTKDDKPYLELISLRGKLEHKSHSVRTGKKLEISESGFQVTSIDGLFENKLTSFSENFSNDILGRNRNYNFEVELEQQIEEIVEMEPVGREIASVETDPDGDWDLLVEEPVDIAIHEDVYDEISFEANKLIQKIDWYKKNKLKVSLHLDEAVKVAMELMVKDSYQKIKTELALELESNIGKMTDKFLLDNRHLEQKKELSKAIDLIAHNKVEVVLAKHLRRKNFSLEMIKDLIYQTVYKDIIIDAHEWGYLRARELAMNKADRLIKNYSLTNPKGLEDLIKIICKNTAKDFSRTIAKDTATKIMNNRSKFAILKGIQLIKPVIKKRMVKLYHKEAYRLVVANLKTRQKRILASEESEEYERMHFRSIQKHDREKTQRRIIRLRN